MHYDFLVKNFLFDHSIFNQIEKDVPTYYSFPSVYILYCKKTKKAYIGESTNIINRLKQHQANKNRKSLKNAKIIFSHFFNKSAVLDIESKLIQNMLADNQFKLLNGNEGLSNHKYYQKETYQKTFEKLWDVLRFDEKIVKKDLLDLQNSDLFKFSPYKTLSEDQSKAIREYLISVINGDSNNITFMSGSSGTGKTVLAVYLIKLLTSDFELDDIDKEHEQRTLIQLAIKAKKKLAGDKAKPNIALIVPMTSLRHTLQKVFGNIYGLSRKMIIGPSAVTKADYDLLIIDEAHRLKRRKNIVAYGSFDKTNQHFNLGHEGNELDWIIRSSPNLLFFYDKSQSIKPSDVPQEEFFALQKKSLNIELKSQMRVKGGENYITFVDRLLTTNPNISKWETPNYEVKLFENFKELVSDLQDKENTEGLCRLISGYSWEWVSRKSSKADATIDGISLYWNRTNKDWINSTNDLTEMGCIHTTQGYELNYTGIIFGTDITYNPITKKIETHRENYFDRNGKAGINEQELHDYIINIYKTLMYRGIKGTYIYCSDPELHKYFKKYIPLHR